MEQQFLQLQAELRAAVQQIGVLQQQVQQGQQVQDQQARALEAQAQRPQRGDRGDGGGGPQRRLGIDARQLPRPDVYDGEDKKWKDWSIVFRSYASLANERIGPLIQRTEQAAGNAPLMNLTFSLHLIMNGCRCCSTLLLSKSR